MFERLLWVTSTRATRVLEALAAAVRSGRGEAATV